MSPATSRRWRTAVSATPTCGYFSGVEIGEAHLWAASAARTVAGAGVERILGSLHAIPCHGRLTAAD